MRRAVPLIAIVFVLAGCGSDDPTASAALKADRFDRDRAFADLRYQVELGPRPAGSEASRQLAGWLRERLPNGRLERVPGGLQNVVGSIPGRGKPILVGAHYDTKDIPGFVGANDGAAGTAAVLEIARALQKADRPPDAPPIRFVLFDGEESPDDSKDFYASGLRGSKYHARRHAKKLQAMILLDFVAEKGGMRIPRENSSHIGSVGQVAGRRAQGRGAVGLPGRHGRRGDGRPHAVPAPRRPRDRPDRLHVRLLPRAVRRHECGLGARARPDGRDRRADAPRLPAVTPEKLLLAAPRGYCAGVDRAVQTVEHALELHGPPVYVRKEIVHNKHVVASLRERGAIFVDELEDTIPEGAITVFSAHGVSPAVHADAERRGLQTIDATCPLVTKVHREAVKFADEGYTIVLIGHAGHEEVEGTTGEAPDHIVLVQTEEDVDALEVPDPERVAYISQTTLSVDETRSIINKLRERFPSIVGPRTDDICYATTNRQAAVKQMAAECDLVLVIGSTNSSNSQRMVEVARDYGARAHLIDNEAMVQEEWLEGARVVGISSGASAPEELVDRLVRFFRDRGTETVETFEVLREDVRFMLPKVIRQQLAAARD